MRSLVESILDELEYRERTGIDGRPPSVRFDPATATYEQKYYINLLKEYILLKRKIEYTRSELLTSKKPITSWGLTYGNAYTIMSEMKEQDNRLIHLRESMARQTVVIGIDAALKIRKYVGSPRFSVTGTRAEVTNEEFG